MARPSSCPISERVRDRYPHLLDDTIAAGLESTASIPLFRSDRSVAGAMGVGWSKPMEFTPIVRSTLTTVSEMCAQALERSQVGDARTQFVRSLQYALLSSIGLRDGLDIAAEYIAANDALGFGGDWYDFIHLSPTRTALVVGDICGHGIEAAARMTQIRGAINALVSLHSDQLGDLFDRAEQQLNLRPTSSSRRSACTSSTLTPTPSATSPPATRRRCWSTNSGTRRTWRTEGDPCSASAAPVPEAAQVDFAPGSILVAYTDGLVEQARDFDQGLQLLSETVQSAQGRTAREISNAVATTISINAPDDIAYTVICRV